MLGMLRGSTLWRFRPPPNLQRVWQPKPIRPSSRPEDVMLDRSVYRQGGHFRLTMRNPMREKAAMKSLHGRGLLEGQVDGLRRAERLPGRFKKLAPYQQQHQLRLRDQRSKLLHLNPSVRTTLRKQPLLR